MIAALTSLTFWIGFLFGFLFLVLVCVLYAWFFPGHAQKGAKKFDDQRALLEQKNLNKKIWKQFYISDKPIK